MQCHIEDLDNRGRRHNLCIHGLPESVEGELLTPTVISLFNSLLDRPPQSPIDMERIHRALRPRSREGEPPRDVVCCLVDYLLKEDILRKARNRYHFKFDGTPIQMYQDLSGITLQHRRELRPLLETLRSKGITYRWKFPFCLSASTQGRSALLKVPEDLPHFFSTLGIPYMDLPNW